jgi:hypothetical protein
MINPEQLIDVANQLVEAPRRGAPRQAKLRRAASTAYYALFHFLLESATRELLGAVSDWPRYRMVYRSFQHNDMRVACQQATKPLSQEIRGVFEIQEFGPEIRLCAQSFLELQKFREEADYDPGAKLTLSDTQGAITKAQTAMQSLAVASQNERQIFLLSLNFKVRIRT